MSIVPQSALLLWFGVIVLPLSILLPNPSWGIPVALGILMFVAISAFDALSAARFIQDVRVETPSVVRMVSGRAAEIVISVYGLSAGKYRIGLGLDGDLRCHEPERTFFAEESSASLRFGCHPEKRGTYRLNTISLGKKSLLGFWEGRLRPSLLLELRVYPGFDTQDLAIAQLLMRKNIGLHARPLVGRGREFEKLREYLPGDPAGDIHWKASARRGRPVTRVFQVERTQEIYLAIDSSRLTAQTIGTQPILDQYVSAALAMSLACRQSGDLFGLLTFTDRVHDVIRAGQGNVIYAACRDSLLRLQPVAASPDYSEVFTLVQERLRRRALIVFLTQLSDPALAEDFLAGAPEVARRHLVAAVSVLAPETRPLFSRPVSTTEDIYEHLQDHYAAQRFEEIRAKLRPAGIRLLAAAPGHVPEEITRLYLDVKRKQAL